MLSGKKLSWPNEDTQNPCHPYIRINERTYSNHASHQENVMIWWLKWKLHKIMTGHHCYQGPTKRCTTCGKELKP